MDIVEKNDSDFFGGDHPKIISLAIDEVNDNPDELVDIRGEGRYFGVGDVETGMTCSNCHQKGHKKAKCSNVICSGCGLMNDHYSNQCPKTTVCSNCGEKGHLFRQCTQKLKRVYCQTCSSSKHTADQCPSIWRSYLTLENNERMGLPSNIYCYNCAEKGHYGDECPDKRTSRVPNLDGSAFSGHNLPKHLREKYFNLSHKRKRDRENDDSSFYPSRWQRSNDHSDVQSNYSEQDQRSNKSKKSKGFVDKIKNAFLSKKGNKDDHNYDGPSRKRPKRNHDGSFKQQIRKTQSVPAFTGPTKSGYLPPRPAALPSGPAKTFELPRNPRSGYLEPSRELKPSRSGALGSRPLKKRPRY